MQQTSDKNQQPKCLPAGGQALKRPALADITNNLTEPSTKAVKNEQADTNLGLASGQNILAKQETLGGKASSELLAILTSDQTNIQPPSLGDISNNAESSRSAMKDLEDILLELASNETVVAEPETSHGELSSDLLAIFDDDQNNALPPALDDFINIVLDENANSEFFDMFVDDETNVQPSAQDDVTNNARQQPSTVANSDQGDNSLDPASDESILAKQILNGKASGELLSYLLRDRPQSLPDLTQTEATDHVDNHPSAAALPLPAIPQPSSSEETPMVLDNSDNQEASVKTNKAPLASLSVSRDAFITDGPEYAEEIYRYLLSIEHKNKAKPGFLLKQPEVTLSMRATLVDWLSQVASEYRLHRETLFLTVNYIDRFLSVMAVKRNKLQLVGVAAMFLAAKYEAATPPVGEFVYITDNAYTKKQIMRMEHLMLKVLEFNLSPPTINWFCERALTYTQARAKPWLLCMYLTELVLMDMDNYLQYPNSLVAAAALCLANFILGIQQPWPKHFVQVTYYTLEELKPCVQKLLQLHQVAERLPQQGIREKYKLIEFQRIALLPSPSVLNI